MKKDDNITFMTKLMTFSAAGALIHPFVFNALEYYSKVVLDKKDLETGLVNPDVWKLCAREVLQKLEKHLRHNPDGCPCCGVAVGELHETSCDIPTCPACGRNLYTCDCSNETLKSLPKVPWTGESPTSRACREYDLYGKWVGSTFTSCSRNDADAEEDTERLFREGAWDMGQQKWIMPTITTE